MERRQTLLINWLYHPAVGHALEAFKHGQGILEENPELDVHILLPPTPATALAPDRLTVHSVDLARPERDLRALPSEWDYLIADPRLRRLGPHDDLLVPAQQAAEGQFRALMDSGVAPVLEEELGETARTVIRYRRNSPLRLRPPGLEPESSDRERSSVHIAILPAGSSGLQSPSLSAWRCICAAIERRLVDSEVTFHFTGRSAAPLPVRDRLRRRLTGREPSSTTSSAVDPKSIAELAGELARSRLWWDCGFAQQIAVIATCDLLIAPHTGFAFLAGALGTPWLALSCCRWPEYYFDQTPFHSILPRCPAYPSLRDETDCTSGHSLDRCLTDLEDRATEIAEEAAWLMRPETTYDQCVARHLLAVDNHPRSDRFYFFDGRDSLIERGVRTP